MAAATEIESYSQLALIDQTIRVTIEEWPRSLSLNLPIAPVFSAPSLTVTVDGLAFGDYAVITGQRPALRLTSERPRSVIVITYLAGFGPKSSDIPDDLAGAIKDQASAFFDLRGEGDGKSNGMSPHMARIAARYRRVAV